MAIPTETQELNRSVLATHNHRRTSHSSFSSESSSSEDSSTSSSGAAPKPNGRRRRHRSRKNKQQQGVSTSLNQSQCHNGHARRHQQQRKTSLSPEQQEALFVAMDCEMVGIGIDGLDSALARVTLINWQGEIILDTFVQPTCPVTDYRTFVSGVTSTDLDNNAMDFETCRTRVMTILNGRILVGHALKNDLTVLNIQHPWYMTRDTAKYEPFMKVRYDGIACPRKLKELSWETLERDIQQIGRPHSSYEDALAALDLYKSVRETWESVMEYKINKTRQIELQQQQQQQQYQQQQQQQQQQLVAAQ